MRYRYQRFAVAGLLIVPLAGCESLPGSPETQAAVAGGAVGAIAGALLAEDDDLFGALVGGALGAGVGYLLAAETDWFEDGTSTAAAEEAVQNAQTDPATVADVDGSNTADLNGDGFVTTDELVALSVSGLSENEIIDRLEATDQIFSVTPQQSAQLIAAGVSPQIVNQLETINQEQRDELIAQSNVIGRPAE